MKSILFLCLLCLVTLSALGSELEEQVLEVSTVNGVILSDPVVALSNSRDVYLPILDVGKILGVQIDQPEKAVFKVFRTPHEADIIDLAKCPSPTNELCAIMVEKNGVYYIRTDYLKDNLQWPIAVDLKAMQLAVSVGAKSRDFVGRNSEEQRPSKIIRKQFDYPALRVEATAASEPKSNILNIYESQPLLNHDSDMLLSTSSEATNFRWTISKEIVESNDAYEIKNYELISTQTLDTKYLFSPTQISGFNLSNVKAGENVFDTQNLYDKGPPRWKVDLYVNEVYLGETYVDTAGNFSFTNVPIFYGQNRILYKLTSPIGKTLEIERTLNVSNDFQGAGRLKYQMAFGQVVGNSDYTGSSMVNYGLTSSISAQAGVAQFVLPSTLEIKRYSMAGLSYLRPSFSMGAQKINSFNNLEHAWIFTPKANLGRLLLVGEYATFNNLKTTLINPFAGNDQTGLKKVSVLAPLQFEQPINVQLAFLENQYASSNAVQQLQARVYSMFPSSSILVESNKFWPSTANPDLYVEYGNYSRAFRGKYGVQMQNDLYAKTKVEIEYLLHEDLYLTFSANAPAVLKEGAYAVGANKVIGDVQTEFNVTYSEVQTITSLTLSTNIKTSEHGVKFSQEETYRQANIELFAFIDENSNGKYDVGEKPYPRLRILETHRQKDYTTDADGIAVIPALNPYDRVTLQVIKESITNIFLTAQDFQSDFILTPAQQLRVELPIKPSFDVRGFVKNSHFKKLVPLELVDSQNAVVATTISNSNGRYKFTDLAGGTYFIRVNKAFLDSNKLVSEPESIAVDLTGKAGVRNAEELSLATK